MEKRLEKIEYGQVSLEDLTAALSVRMAAPKSIVVDGASMVSVDEIEAGPADHDKAGGPGLSKKAQLFQSMYFDLLKPFASKIEKAA